jgi:hypothetical protein
MHKGKTRSQELSGWEGAISDAERKLKHTLTRTERLRAAIETFKAHKREGKPWPGNKSAASPPALQDSRGV